MATNANIRNELQVFAQVWRQCKREVCHETCGGDCAICRPAPHVAEQLLRLIANEPQSPVRELAPVIAGIIQDSRFTSAGGDLMIDGNRYPPIEMQTELVVRTLERLRQAATAAQPPIA